VPIRLNACLNSTKHDNTIDNFKWHGGQWIVYDAWFHTGGWCRNFGIYSKRNKTSITIGEEGNILSC